MDLTAREHYNAYSQTPYHLHLTLLTSLNDGSTRAWAVHSRRRPLSIFSYLPTDPPSFRDVLAVSHVCKQWRSLAVDHSPELWRRYVFLSKRDGSVDAQFAEEIIGRCGALTLDVGWEWDHEPYAGSNTTATEAIVTYTPYNHRFRYYHLILPKERSWLLKSQLALNTWNPIQMEELSVRERVQGDRIRRFFDGIEIVLPALRKVTLQRCWIQLHRMSLRNLQHFNAVFLSAGPMAVGDGFPSTFYGWLRHLSGWPVLVTLRLQILSPTPELIAWPDYQTALTDHLARDSQGHHNHVSLEHLTDIHISLYYHDLEIFIDHVTIPPARKASFHIYASRPGPLENLRNRIRSLVSRHAVPSRTRGNRLTISVNADGSVCTTSFSKKKEYRSPSPGHHFDDLTISVHALQSNGAYEPMKTYLVHVLVGWALVLRRITSLRIDIAPENVPEGFKKAMHSMLLEATDLRTLFCRKDVVPHIIRRHSKLVDLGDGVFICRLARPSSDSSTENGTPLRRTFRHGPEIRIVTYD